MLVIQRLHSAQLSNSTRLQPEAGVCIPAVHRRHEPYRVVSPPFSTIDAGDAVDQEEEVLLHAPKQEKPT